MQDLTIAVERLKEDLSSVKSRRHVMRFGGAVCHIDFTRDELEKLTEGLLDKTIAVTERTIAAARDRGVTRFDDVLLVGGMTRMPAVARVLKDRLGLTARLHQPDFAVAKGAALFALTRTIRPAGGASSGLRSAEDVAASTGLTVPEVEEIARKRVATVVSRGFGVMSLDGRAWSRLGLQTRSRRPRRRVVRRPARPRLRGRLREDPPARGHAAGRRSGRCGRRELGERAAEPLPCDRVAFDVMSCSETGPAHAVQTPWWTWPAQLAGWLSRESSTGVKSGPRLSRSALSGRSSSSCAWRRASAGERPSLR
jgi:hypothetical protein